MISAIIGSRGFIGSRLKWYADNYLDEEWIGIHKDNYEMWRGATFNNVIWAAGTARKDLPYGTLYGLNVHNFIQMIRDFKICSKLIYISSQAVYDEGQGKETDVIHSAYLSGYGKSKAEGELIASSFESFLIIRPNGFVGPGLKKNVIHSLAKNPPELYYSWDSRFQIIHADIFAAVTFMLASSFNNEIFNVALPQVVTPAYVAEVMGVDIKTVVQPRDRVVPHVRAVMDTTKLETMLKGGLIALPTAEEAIRKWNEPFGIKIPMFGMRNSVGESGNGG